MTSAVLGGTGSVLGGGKFANGAVTGAYGSLFNELSHGLSKEQAGYERRMSRLGFADAVDQWATGYGMDIRVPIDSFDLRVASPSASWRSFKTAQFFGPVVTDSSNTQGVFTWRSLNMSPSLQLDVSPLGDMVCLYEIAEPQQLKKLHCEEPK